MDGWEKQSQFNLKIDRQNKTHHHHQWEMNGRKWRNGRLKIRRHLLLRFIIKEKSFVFDLMREGALSPLTNTIDIFLCVFGLLRFMLIHNLGLKLKLISLFKSIANVNYSKKCDVGQHTKLPAEKKNLIYSAIKNELSSPQSVVTRMFVSYHFTSSCAFIYLFASILNISSHNIRSLIYFFFVPSSFDIRCNALRWMKAFKVWTCEQFECAITKRWISINFNWEGTKIFVPCRFHVYRIFYTPHVFLCDAFIREGKCFTYWDNFKFNKLKAIKVLSWNLFYPDYFWLSDV